MSVRRGFEAHSLGSHGNKKACNSFELHAKALCWVLLHSGRSNIAPDRANSSALAGVQHNVMSLPRPKGGGMSPRHKVQKLWTKPMPHTVPFLL